MADDRMSADEAYGLACQGTALLWRGDFQNARQLLIALGRRADHRHRKHPQGAPADASTDGAQAFHRYRQARAQRARTLSALLIEMTSGYAIALRRAPDVHEACLEAYGPADGPTVMSLRTLLGLIGAHEWRKHGIEVPAAGGRIHPHYGVFAPIRGEYLDLVATAPLPPIASSTSVAFDIGTGSGVLAAILARRGFREVVATDLDARAQRCARENIERLGLTDQVQVRGADLFPHGQAALAVCNPPWLPARPSSALEHAIYDPDSHMLKGFLSALRLHLVPQGEGWLILSDLAEHLSLRSRAQLLQMFEQARLTVLGRQDSRPRHAKALDTRDALHAARAAEVTSLWRLGARDAQS